MAKKKRVNRAKFVRSFSHDVPAAVVIEAAAKEGIALSAADVHSARYYAKKMKVGGLPPSPSPTAESRGSDASVERSSSSDGHASERRARLENAAVTRDQDSSAGVSESDIQEARKLIVKIGVAEVRKLLSEIESMFDLPARRRK